MHEAAGMGGKGPMMVAILWAENFLSLVIISMRLYTRKFVKGKLGWDDICLIITWVCIPKTCCAKRELSKRIFL